MATLVPGQARFLRLPEPAGIPHVALLLCDQRERAPLGRCSFKLRARVFLQEVNALRVAAVVVMVKLLTNGEERLYAAWINELAPDGAEVLEALANQEKLKVWFAPPDRIGASSTVIPNVLRADARRHLSVVLEAATNSPWDVHDFALCRTWLEDKFPTATSLWEQLKADRL
jgi:hypothetical protein